MRIGAVWLVYGSFALAAAASSGSRSAAARYWRERSAPGDRECGAAVR